METRSKGSYYPLPLVSYLLLSVSLRHFNQAFDLEMEFKRELDYSRVEGARYAAKCSAAPIE
jgi:hypothetical protein